MGGERAGRQIQSQLYFAKCDRKHGAISIMVLHDRSANEKPWFLSYECSLE
jgi:hypothetical protein